MIPGVDCERYVADGTHTRIHLFWEPDTRALHWCDAGQRTIVAEQHIALSTVTDIMVARPSAELASIPNLDISLCLSFLSTGITSLHLLMSTRESVTTWLAGANYLLTQQSNKRVVIEESTPRLSKAPSAAAQSLLLLQPGTVFTGLFRDADTHVVTSRPLFVFFHRDDTSAAGTSRSMSAIFWCNPGRHDLLHTNRLSLKTLCDIYGRETGMWVWMCGCVDVWHVREGAVAWDMRMCA